MGAESRQLEPLYMGPLATEKETMVRQAIREKKPMPGLYLITYASNPAEQLDILPAVFLFERPVRERLPVVVGAAITKKEAFAVVEQIAAEAFRATGRVQLQAYLNSRRKPACEV